MSVNNKINFSSFGIDVVSLCKIYGLYDTKTDGVVTSKRIYKTDHSSLDDSATRTIRWSTVQVQFKGGKRCTVITHHKSIKTSDNSKNWYEIRYEEKSTHLVGNKIKKSSETISVKY